MLYLNSVYLHYSNEAKTKTNKMKNLDSIKTKSGKVNKHIINAITWIRPDKEGKVRPIKWLNNGRSLEDKSDHFKRALKAGGYKIKEGNDSPRGGQDGYFIKLSKPAQKFLQSLISQ